MSSKTQPPSLQVLKLFKKLKQQQHKRFLNWKPKNDRKLKKLVKSAGEKNWKKIAKKMKKFDEEDCLLRFRKITDCKSKKGAWNKTEDNLLVKYVKKLGDTTWPQISSLLKGRNSKQCRERWRNQLDPKINRDPLTKKEQELLKKKVDEIGTRWCILSTFFIGRPDNMLKNYYYSILLQRKRKNANKKKTINNSEKNKIINHIPKPNPSQNTKKKKQKNKKKTTREKKNLNKPDEKGKGTKKTKEKKKEIKIEKNRDIKGEITKKKSIIGNRMEMENGKREKKPINNLSADNIKRKRLYEQDIENNHLQSILKKKKLIKKKPQNLVLTISQKKKNTSARNNDHKNDWIIFENSPFNKIETKKRNKNSIEEINTNDNQNKEQTFPTVSEPEVPRSPINESFEESFSFNLPDLNIGPLDLISTESLFHFPTNDNYNVSQFSNGYKNSSNNENGGDWNNNTQFDSANTLNELFFEEPLFETLSESEFWEPNQISDIFHYNNSDLH